MDANPLSLELETHRRYLLRVARLELRDAELAEDVVQETLVAALAGRDGFSNRSSVRARRSSGSAAGAGSGLESWAVTRT